MIALLKRNSESQTYYRLIETETDEYLGRCSVFKYANRYELWNVRIFDPFQNNGYGSLMLKEIIKRYTRFGKPLILYVYKDNEIAINLYKKLGFKITGTYGDNAWEMQYKEKR